MIKNKSVFSVFVAAMMGGSLASAQEPDVYIYNDGVSTSLEALSDNGEWAVGYAKSPISELGYSYPKLYNVKTHEVKNLYKDGEENKIAEMKACGVTDDGTLVIGQYDGRPALYSVMTESWKSLPVSAKGFKAGSGSSITPDGKYAIGTVNDDNWNETIVVWDLTGDEPVDITPDNLPKPISMFGEVQDYKQLRAVDLSADGSKFIGLVGFSYMGEQWTFVYDMPTKTWQAVGFDVTEKGEGYSFTPTGEGYMFLEGGKFRPGTNEIAGIAYLSSDVDGIYTYDISSGKVSIVDGSDGKLFGGVDRYGLIYASNPSGMPLRNWEVKAGKYWYDFKVLYRQLWNKDWQNDVLQDQYGYTGTFMGVSDNGLVLLANEYTNKPYDSYVISLEEPLSELCPKVNILDNYVVYPVNNSAFSILKEVKVMFDRNIEIVGEPYNAVKVVDPDGNEYAHSVNVTVDVSDSRLLSITFRNTVLEVGTQYTVVIPEGVVCVAGDAEKLNPEIKVNYTGRPKAPVKPVKISPADGIKLEKINASSNPISITFDAEISAVEEGGSMYLYLINDNEEREEIAQLSGSITGNTLSVYPVMEQRLAKGSNYEVVIEANTVADISGADPNEEIVIHYEGNYIPNSETFEDYFDNGITLDKWMLYDGDQLEPAAEPAGWGFSKELPWWVARDSNESTDMCAVSHSMYTPAGKSDDWMVTSQIYISDETGMLSFKSQSYKNDATDRLKVYVYATDDVYTALTETIVDRIRYNGDLVYDEVESPGASEEFLAGDWKENVIPLEKYAGKYIYIAFVNDNRNQSAVFVEDVVVSRDKKYSLVNSTPESVVAQEEVTVKGILIVESQTETYKGYELTLADADGNVVSTVADAGKELTAGDEVKFTFPEALKTTVGKEVKYSINVKLGDLSEKIEASVKNLAVKTTKRVVLEEYTGQTCPNCPLGHAALDIIEKDFGDAVIPVAIHTYPGDNFSTPMAVELQEFLGFQAAPTGRINRRPIASPMDIIDGKYYYKDNGLWYDYVVAELGEYADADVKITSAVYDGENYKVNVDVTYALDMDNRNVNIFTVITEDGLAGTQTNNRCEVEDPLLGDWGKGGIYGQANVPYTYNHVVRTWAGTTCNGTGGYIPSSVVGGQVYTAEISVPKSKRILNPENTGVTVMLIDASTGLVVNAGAAKMTTSGVEGIEADSESSAYVENGDVIVKASALTLVDVYSVDGTRIASQAGEGEFAIDLNGYAGTAIVTLKSENGVKSMKIFVK